MGAKQSVLSKKDIQLTNVHSLLQNFATDLLSWIMLSKFEAYDKVSYFYKCFPYNHYIIQEKKNKKQKSKCV